MQFLTKPLVTFLWLIICQSIEIFEVCSFIIIGSVAGGLALDNPLICIFYFNRRHAIIREINIMASGYLTHKIIAHIHELRSTVTTHGLVKKSNFLSAVIETP